jgi:hypothetical protein
MTRGLFGNASDLLLINIGALGLLLILLHFTISYGPTHESNTITTQLEAATTKTMFNDTELLHERQK